MFWLLLLLLMLLIPAIVAVGVWRDTRPAEAPNEPPGAVVGLRGAGDRRAP
jgi:hypothetical protein